VENFKEYPYHVLDPTTPWYEFLQYCEICHQLNAPGQPKLGRYMAYRRYLKEMGIIE
jgi:mono/diheme cytochrome c family protein